MKLKMVIALGLSATALLMANQNEEQEPAKPTEGVVKTQETAKAEVKTQPETESECGGSCKN